MGMSKTDLHRKNSSLAKMLAELEAEAKMDPLKKDWRLHDRIAELKKKLE
ncbi:MAG: hypothetical protein V1787_04140 [Candidatus Micrarchaeota archaeon]